MPNGKTLTTLAAEANRQFTLAHTSLKTALTHARDCGRALREAKKLVKHGQWEDWVTVHFHGSLPLARQYMMIARRWKKVAPLLDGDPTLSINAAAKLLTHPPDPGPRGGMMEMVRNDLRKRFAKEIDKWDAELLLYLHSLTNPMEGFDIAPWELFRKLLSETATPAILQAAQWLRDALYQIHADYDNPYRWDERWERYVVERMEVERGPMLAYQDVVWRLLRKKEDEQALPKGGQRWFIPHWPESPPYDRKRYG